MKKYLILILLFAPAFVHGQEAKVYSTIEEELSEKEQKKFMRGLSDIFRYPANARRKGIEGVVKIEFAINPDGSTSNFSIIESVDPDLDEEGMRALKRVSENTLWKKSDATRWILFPFKFKLG
jgi:protein TonB